VNCAWPLRFDLAWVWVDCSTAYPVAVGVRHLLASSEPLHENGKRAGGK
jgi:hypothetical protein